MTHRTRRALQFFLFSTLVLTLFVAASRRRPVGPPNPAAALEINRSFAITDPAILDGFSFERVLNALVERSDTTAMQLYQQWFDTQNPSPGLVVAAAPHCDDFRTKGEPSFNGFPRRCPTPEGALATSRPFVPPHYIPVALINRFDLTPLDGSNCGQYRIIFARTVRNGPLDRVNLIFEPVLPNPNPAAGVAGCQQVAQFWADLSAVSSISERRARLEGFFFGGLPGFAPVIHVDHLGAASGGSIRSLHYTGGALIGPRFYQFRLEKNCHGAGCTLIVQPEVLENTVTGRLFDGNESTPAAQQFRRDFLRQVESLAIRDVNLYFMNLPREFLLAESDPGAADYAALYNLSFLIGHLSKDGRQFSADIQRELNRVGSRLSPFDIVSRAETQTCVGCHLTAGSIGDGVSFPRPGFPFEHVSEALREPGEAGSRFAISPAMRNVFIPHRMKILQQFLAHGTPPVHSNKADDVADAPPMTLGGVRKVH
jgi:hypothetical protein